MNLVDIAGWLGAFLILLAYFLNVKHLVTAHSFPFLILNLVGASLIVVNTFYLQAYPPMVLNMVWAAVAVYGLSKRFVNNSEER